MKQLITVNRSGINGKFFLMNNKRKGIILRTKREAKL